MKPNQLLFPATAAVILFVITTAASTICLAQVKIGLNPATITPNTNLSVEGYNNTRMLVTKSNDVGVGIRLTPQERLDVWSGDVKVLPSTATQIGSLGLGISDLDGFEVVTNLALDAKVINPATTDAYVVIQRSGLGAPLLLAKPYAGGGDLFIEFNVGGQRKGAIQYDGLDVQYLQNSDQRLKENIRTTKFGLQALKAVKVYDYNFKSNSKKVLSTVVLAQQLYKVYPRPSA